MTLPSRARMSASGRSRSRAKLAALDHIHTSRRGVPVHPPSDDLRRGLIAVHQRGLRAAGGNRNANRWSLRALGRAVGVAPRTISRWMSGHHRPAPEHHTAIARIIRAARS